MLPQEGVPLGSGTHQQKVEGRLEEGNMWYPQEIGAGGARWETDKVAKGVLL